MTRFWAKVQKSDGCWLWTAGTDDKGYGWLNFRGKSTRAHRVAWILTNGEIPEGKSVLHSCDNPPCCNPAHLFLGTQIDNIADMVAKGRHSSGSGEKHSAVMRRVAARGEDWKRAHPEKFVKGEKNPVSKLTDAQAREIVALSSSSSQRKLAKQFGVCKSTIGNIIRGETY